MRWSPILVAGIGTSVVVFLVITLAATGYAFKLAFEVRGAPDQARIGHFAAHLGRSYWCLQFFDGSRGSLGGPENQESYQLQGVLVGLVAAATGFLMALTVSARTMAAFALTVGAGWLGGAMAARHRMKQDRGRPTTR